MSTRLIATVKGPLGDDEIHRLRLIEAWDFDPMRAGVIRVLERRGGDASESLMADGVLAMQQAFAALVMGLKVVVPSEGTDLFVEQFLLLTPGARLFGGQVFGRLVDHDMVPLDEELVRRSDEFFGSRFIRLPGGPFRALHDHPPGHMCVTKLGPEQTTAA